ncbi:MAG: hypothetical protein RLZZ519_1715 [Bacteroidota bacterium]|jgi:hypothetical protein
MVSRISPPNVRKLRGYAMDPSLDTSLSTVSVNDLTYQIDWEELLPRGNGQVGSFPVGEYLEIVDYDPASGLFYEPVDMDDPYLLAQDGHTPSVGNPQFHQQMVYAVMMTTIKNFERALGRKVLWAENILKKDQSKREFTFEFVQRLKVYPHALRQANAFYDPFKKALLFGYFKATPSDVQLHYPGGNVFSCLSHDIIAHETTHAILDGFHRRYIEATHPDTLAFHEAFSDLVALFQHFSFPDVLKHQIAQTRGDLNQQNLLGQLALQFGKAIGAHGSLRDAIGSIASDGTWQPKVPDPKDYATIMDVHPRGSLLVAAIFDAFLNIYRNRAKVYIRIATAGTGVLPEGELPIDLVNILAETAAKTASQVLGICIRALDYCPPMDITFGDYLRALITADADMVANDIYGYRVAFTEAFQKRGIYAAGVKSMSQEELMYDRFPEEIDQQQMQDLGNVLRKIKAELGYVSNRQQVYEATKNLIGGAEGLHHQLRNHFVEFDENGTLSSLCGLMFPREKATSESLGLEWGYLVSGAASFAVSNLWLANRVTPEGAIANHVIITLAQKRGVRMHVQGNDITVDETGYFVPDHTAPEDMGENHIVFRGGCTLIFDLDTLQLRYVIQKNIDDKARMMRQFKFQKAPSAQTYFDNQALLALGGPIAHLHSFSHAH